MTTRLTATDQIAFSYVGSNTMLFMHEALARDRMREHERRVAESDQLREAAAGRRLHRVSVRAHSGRGLHKVARAAHR